MKTFIKKHQFNYIKKCLFDLNNAFRNCTDTTIILATKASIQDKILIAFTNLSDAEKQILNIDKITLSLHIESYINNLNQYVYGMPTITNNELNKIFKKEKKLKLPTSFNKNSQLAYLGWIDESVKKLFIVYKLNNKFIGMACRLPKTSSNNTNICALCNHVGDQTEVAFVSPICKTSNTIANNYKSIGFTVCLDSTKCNERIVSTEKLENILKIVNNLK